MSRLCHVKHLFLFLNIFFISGIVGQPASVLDFDYQNDTSSLASEASNSTFRGISEAGNTTLGDGDIHLECVDSGSFTAEIRPESTDCAKALMKMPALAEFREFTRGHDPAELYKLPKLYTQGRCQVTLDLVRGVNRLEYSWMWMRMDASALAWACHQPTGSSGKPYRTGGVTRTGPQQSLEIRIKKSPRPEGTPNDNDRAAASNSSTSDTVGTS